VLVTLPPELTQAQRINLARDFSQELTNKYQSAIDLAVHLPRPNSDPRHHHAHILMTTREIAPQGLGPRTVLELSGTERHARGLGPSKDELLWIRERWASVANEALKRAGLDARIDHRSYEAQGVDLDPKAFIPHKVHYAEAKSGVRSKAGDEIRARHRELVEARAKGSVEFARILLKQKEKARLRAIEYYRSSKDLPKRTPRAALTRQERNQINVGVCVEAHR
jgi:ATP-dependent exoDNAse (exonuclease V) alpha subunit